MLPRQSSEEAKAQRVSLEALKPSTAGGRLWARRSRQLSFVTMAAALKQQTRASMRSSHPQGVREADPLLSAAFALKDDGPSSVKEQGQDLFLVLFRATSQHGQEIGLRSRNLLRGLVSQGQSDPPALAEGQRPPGCLGRCRTGWRRSQQMQPDLRQGPARHYPSSGFPSRSSIASAPGVAVLMESGDPRLPQKVPGTCGL